MPNDQRIDAQRTPPSVDEFMSAFRLSRRQAEVARLLFLRRTNAEIASTLGIRPSTAANHVSVALLKMGISSRRDVEKLVTSDLTPAGGV